jgi:membrane fusion protein (multidrug efflux system)
VFTDYVGQVVATANVDVRARVEGYITKVAFVQGSIVQAGDLLFQIEKEPIEQRLLRARAGLADAQATLLKSEQDIARYKPLVEQRAIPRQDLENAEAAKLRAEAAVEAAKADQRMAELDLGYTDVVATISGKIGSNMADQGDLVGGFGSKALATISPLDPIWFEVNVSEVEYIDVRARIPVEKRSEWPVRLVLANGLEHPLTGHFVFEDRTVDPRTGTLRVRAAFGNPDNTLTPGQFGRLRVLTQMRKDAVLVPQRAVQEIQGTYSVFCVAGETAKFTRVKVGPRVGALWLIESGLKRGDRVVVDGLIRVRDGAAVKATSTTVDDAPVAELRKRIPKEG